MTNQIVAGSYSRHVFEVLGVQVTEENYDDVAAWCEGDVRTGAEGTPDSGKYIRVPVRKPQNPRQAKAYAGDWILWNPQGGYKVYKESAFKRTFEPKTDGKLPEKPANTRPLIAAKRGPGVNVRAPRGAVVLSGPNSVVPTELFAPKSTS